MSVKEKLGAAVVVALVVAVWLYACVSSGPGSDFDGDGVKDSLEDRNGNFAFDPGESDFLITDTDSDTLCDGQPDHPLATCNGCEDCNNNGFWDCSQGNVQLAYGASLPPGKPFPVPPTPTLTPAPFPTSTPGRPPTPNPSFTPSL
jgi:hypothetical protein